MLASFAMVMIARRFVAVSEAVNQTEAELRYALTRLRDNGESIALLGGEKEEHEGLRRSLGSVLRQWLLLCYQHMRATVVSNGNSVLAPVVPLVLCAPKFLDGSMTLGEVMQVAGAFIYVQSAFNWLVDNYPRLADWLASVRRVGSLTPSLDYLEAVGRPGEPGTIRRIEYDAPALRLRDLSVTLKDGTVVINDADVVVNPGERILLMVNPAPEKHPGAGDCRPVAMGKRRDIHPARGQAVFDAAISLRSPGGLAAGRHLPLSSQRSRRWEASRDKEYRRSRLSGELAR